MSEYTKFGWTVMSPGTGADVDSMFVVHTMPSDFEELCRMDVLGIEDPPERGARRVPGTTSAQPWGVVRKWTSMER